MAQLIPYLSFSNNCREAMNFYQNCLGGELEFHTVGSMPEMAAQMPPEMKDQIMHSMLKNAGITIYASDLNREKPNEGNTIHLCIVCDTEEEMTRFFTGLSAGGKIVEPIADVPWGAKYGELIDKYGKCWMFNLFKPHL